MRNGRRNGAAWDRASVKRVPVREQTCTCARALVSHAASLAGETGIMLCLACLKPVSARRVTAKATFLRRRLAGAAS